MPMSHIRGQAKVLKINVTESNMMPAYTGLLQMVFTISNLH